jgi:cytochrome P450
MCVLLNSVVAHCTVTPLGIARTVTEDNEYKGYHIPKGTTVLPNVWYGYVIGLP